jgi:hypothetical protein
MMSWIKLHRRLLDSDVFKKPDHLKIWTYFLLKASHRGKTFKHGDQTIQIEPGSFVSGRQKIAEETGYSESKIRRFLEAKKATNKITIKSTKQYSIITICKYSDYQIDEKETDQQKGQQTDHNQEYINILKTTNVVSNIVGKPTKKRSQKQTETDPHFEEWWSKFRKASASPEGSKKQAASQYQICSEKFSPDQINVATRHYLIECRKAGYSTKHGSSFLKLDLIEQYQDEPLDIQPAQEESYLDKQYRRIHGTESEHAGSITPRLKSLRD